MSDMGERMARSEEILEVLRDESKEQTKMLRGIWNTIHGENESPGIKGRLDRLEQTDARRTWWFRTAVGGSIAAIATAVFSLFRAH